MNWKRISDEGLNPRRRVLVYSPVYEGRDETMLYRLIDSLFLKVVEEAEWYCDLTPPQNNNI